MTAEASLINNTFNKKTSKALNIFWAGYIIYSASYTLLISGVVTSKIILYLQLLGAAIFLLPAIRLIKFKIENAYLRNIYIIYYGWLLYVLTRGIQFNKIYILDKIVDASGGLFLYLAPLILLFPRDLVYLKKVINVILILSVIYVLLDIIFHTALLTADSENGQTIVEYFAKNLGITCGFILLTFSYHQDKKKWRALYGKLWVIFVIGLTFLLALVRARRGLMFMSLNILFFAYVIYYYENKNKLKTYIPVFLVLIIVLYAINTFDNNSKKGPFALITKRLNEDTRSGVETYFYLDLTDKDWIIGKGADGLYYCPSGATADGYRGVIETDYLQIILKGGIISLGLLFLITIPAIFLGIFYSKNMLSKAAGVWILLWLIDLFPATVTTFYLNYLVVWICIGICYTKEIRRLPEDKMKEYFNYKMF